MTPRRVETSAVDTCREDLVMMELQQAALDVRIREHDRQVDNANRNGWVRPDPQPAEPRAPHDSIVGAVRSYLALNRGSGRQIDRAGYRGGSVTDERAWVTV